MGANGTPTAGVRPFGPKIFYKSKPCKHKTRSKADGQAAEASASLANARIQCLGSSSTTATLLDEPLLRKLSESTIDKHSDEFPIQPIRERGRGTVKTILRLIKEISQAFSQVPYIRAVAGVVEQIITISDEVQANKTMTQELIERIMNYSNIIFNDLLTHQDEDVAGLKVHLIQITSVLESIYKLLKATATSRLNRLIFRDDIASQIAEQGRKLDAVIVTFQVKSLIEVRKSLQNPPKSIIVDGIALRHYRIKSSRSKPQIMFGRQKEIDTVVDAILDADKADVPIRIPMLGSGGIGKTTLALSVMYDDRICAKFGSKRVFVSCEASSSPDVFIGEIATSLKISTRKSNDAIFQSVLRQLEKYPIFLVLDNFETTWDPPDTRTEIESLLTAITCIKTLVCIVTMRGSERPAGIQWSNVLPPLQPIDLQSAVAIFRAISFKADDYSIKLVQAVDCVPLAVTLMAHLASVDGETTEALWSRWQKESTSMVERGGDRLSSLEKSVQTSLSSPRMQRDPSAEAFLSLLSLLPDGMSPNTLRVCEEGLSNELSVKKAMATLRQNALIYEDSSGTLLVLSPIRLFMCAHRPPSPECRQILYNHFIQLALQGSSYHDPIIRLQLEKEAGNINAILLGTLKDANTTSLRLEEVIGAVINFCHYTYVSGFGSSESLLTAGINRLQLLQNSGSAIPALQQAKIQQAKNILWPYGLIKGYTKETPSSNGLHSDIDFVTQLQADCLGCWGQMLSRQLQFELAREKFYLARDLHVKSGDVSGEAFDILNIALLLSRDLKNFDEALLAFQDAIRRHDMANDILGKAHGLLGAGHLLRGNFRFAEARDMFDRATASFADIEYNAGRLSALNGIGSILQACSRFSEAEQYFTKVVQLSAEIGDVVSQADGLMGLALSVLLMSRYTEAQDTIEKAIKLRQPFHEADHLHVLARALMAKREFERAEEIFCLSRTLHEDSGDKLGLWYDFYHLALMAFSRGETKIAERIAEKELCLPSTLLQEAHLLTLNATIFIRHGDLTQALPLLTAADDIYSQVNATFDRAFCFQHIGIIHLRNGKFQLAMECFTQALRIHTQIGNVQGEADDMNKMCQTLLEQNRPEEALARISKTLELHTQIEDPSGQGDDLHILATIYMVQNKLVDAEQTIQQALEMHKLSESKYGQARDLTRLSEIIWKMQIGRQRVEGGMSDSNSMPDALSILRQAVDLFEDVSASVEADEYGELGHCLRVGNPDMVDLMECVECIWGFKPTAAIYSTGTLRLK